MAGGIGQIWGERKKEEESRHAGESRRHERKQEVQYGREVTPCDRT